MKRIYKFLILLLVVTSYSVMSANAEDTVCTFEKDLTVTFSSEGQTTINSNFYPNVTKDYVIWQEDIGDVNSTENIQIQLPELSGCCPNKIYYCKLEKTELLSGLYDKIKNVVAGDFTGLSDFFSRLLNVGRIEKTVYLFSTEDEADAVSELSKYEDGATKGFVAINSLKKLFTANQGRDFKEFFSDLWDVNMRLNMHLNMHLNLINGVGYEAVYKECGYINYTGTSDSCTYNLACPNLLTFDLDFRDALKKYTECGPKDAACKSQRMALVNEREDQMRSYCNNIIENYDFDEGTEQNCLDSCFKISEIIIGAKKNAGLLSSDTGECGVSSRLIAWGLNIMKWLKYIIPVIVIILSILEFIKVIGAGKEDEMKKVQGRFIRRLIAAALIFIIPFIIEFALDKFGFTEYIDGCGIIEEIE